MLFLIALLLAVILVVLIIDDQVFSGTTVTGSGIAATQTRSVPPFANIEMTGMSSLNARIGARQSVVVRADSNVVSRITTHVQSGRLVVGNKPGSYSIRTPITVEVTVPSLSTVALEGSGQINATGIHEHALALSLAGFGAIHAAGAVNTLRVTISGAGTAQLVRLTARDVTAVISGNGQVDLTATHSLNARVTGNGAISYLGNPPHVRTSVTGAGAITRG